MSKGDWSWLPEEARNQWGMTVSELAAWLGVKRQVVDNWIRGRNDPDLINVFKLARLVGSSEELARRAGLEIEFSPPGVIQFRPPMQLAKDRDYEYLRQVVEWMKYTSNFKEMYEQSYTLLRDVAGKDKIFTAQVLFNLAYSELMLGRPQDAIASVTKARELLPPKRDSLLLADTHWFSGECLRVVSKISEAQLHLEEARKMYKRLKAKPSFQFSGPFWLEWDFGRLNAAYGQYDKAIEHFNHMEKMARDIWLAEGEVIAAWSYGDIDETRSNFKAAHAAYFDAKQLANQIGDKFWEAMALWRIAEVYRKMSSYEAALQAAKAAREIFEVIGNERMIAKIDCTTAACYLQTGKPTEAHELYYRAVEIFKQAEDTPLIHSALLGFGYTRLLEESQKPNPNFKEVLPIFRDIDSKRPDIYDPNQTVCEALGLAEALRLAGYHSQALERFHSVVKVSNKHGYQLEKAHALLGIAAVKLMNGEADRESCIEALKIYRKLGSLWGQAQTLITLAMIELEARESGPVFQEALELARDIGLTAESTLIEELLIGKSVALKKHVLLFI